MTPPRLWALRTWATDGMPARPRGTTEAHQDPKGGSKASPANQGPVQNPPSQGVPTNPAQPRR